MDERKPIDTLLEWAYREELVKLYSSSAEGIWDRIGDMGWLGGIDSTRGTPQRYDFGVPDPDAERIERAVSALPDITVDWEASRDAVGDIAALITSRDVLLVRPFKTAALVTMHAKMGTRPDWREEPPHPWPVEPEHGPKNVPKVVGKCYAKNRYSEGAYCPLKWDPSPLSTAIMRLEYAAWHRGLVHLAETLELSRYKALPPTAPAQPWNEGKPTHKIYAVGEASKRPLPLKPQRDLMGPRPSPPRASRGRKISPGGESS